MINKVNKAPGGKDGDLGHDLVGGKWMVEVKKGTLEVSKEGADELNVM